MWVDGVGLESEDGRRKDDQSGRLAVASWTMLSVFRERSYTLQACTRHSELAKLWAEREKGGGCSGCGCTVVCACRSGYSPHNARDIVKEAGCLIIIFVGIIVAMGNCGSKQQKKDAVIADAGSGPGSSSSSKPNQQSNKLGEKRNDEDDMDAVRYLRKQKGSPSKVGRSPK